MPATVLDSHALLVFLRGESGGEIIRQLLEKASERSGLHMTEVNYAGVNTSCAARMETRRGNIVRELPALPIAFHPVTRVGGCRCRDGVKSRFAISLADAFAAAPGAR